MKRFSNIPSLVAAKSRLLIFSSSNRVPNSLMLNCADGGAGFYLALELAKHMVCDNPSVHSACNECNACKQFSAFNYPDLHLSFPFNKSTTSGNETDCLAFRNQLVNELLKNPFITHQRWLAVLNIANKQAAITVGESKSIAHMLSMKSFSSKPRVVIIWQPELLNQSAANKLLKLIEEPGENVHFFLISHRPESVLKTIQSRSVLYKVPLFSDEEIMASLQSIGASQNQLSSVVLTSNGSLGAAIDTISNTENSDKSFAILVAWLRAIYTNRQSALLDVCENISSMYREEIKLFLEFTTSIFRQSLLFDYAKTHNTSFKYDNFSLERFVPFIATDKSDEILEIIENCRKDISRNANSKIVLLDTSLLLTKYISKA